MNFLSVAKRFLVAVVALAAPVAIFAQGANVYLQHNLVANSAGVADVTDPNLVDPWGLSYSAAGPFWVSNHFAGNSTIYNGAGAITPTVVVVPGGKGATSPTRPTGQVQNPTTAFLLANGRPASFIFVTEDGALSAWNAGTVAEIKADNSSVGAVYKGLAINPAAAAPLLYAANFNSGKIDVFNGTFAPATLPGGFADPNLPAGYAPFNIWPLGGKLYVEYAKQDANKFLDVAGAGNGIVDVFDFNGNLLSRLITGGVLNSPWGVAIAPPSWGAFGGALLVGNFGDGRINAFDVTSGKLLGTLQGASGNPIVLSGLWALLFGNGGRGGDANTLYFTAGVPNGSSIKRGILGSLAPPASIRGVTNAAGGQSNAVAPGEIVVITGQSVGPSPLLSATIPYSGYVQTWLGPTSVTVNNIIAPVLYSSGAGTSVVVPYGIAGASTASFILANGEQITGQFTLPVAASVPGVFTLTGTTGPAVAFNGDATSNAAANAAPAGSVISIFATGEGLTRPYGQDGLVAAWEAPRGPVQPVSLTIGGKPAQVLYAGSQSGTVSGNMQVDAIVPAGITAGAAPVVLTVGGASSQAKVTVFVK